MSSVIDHNLPIERDRYINVLSTIEGTLSWLDGLGLEDNKVAYGKNEPHKLAARALIVLRERYTRKLRRVEADLSL